MECISKTKIFFLINIIIKKDANLNNSKGKQDRRSSFQKMDNSIPLLSFNFKIKNLKKISLVLQKELHFGQFFWYPKAKIT